jgi:hypothetical protein
MRGESGSGNERPSMYGVRSSSLRNLLSCGTKVSEWEMHRRLFLIFIFKFTFFFHFLVGSPLLLLRIHV